MATYAVILAAGKGTRMKSDRLKVAHEVAGKPIVQCVIDTVNGLSVDRIFVVVGHQAELLKSVITDDNITFIAQGEQLGTGHAVMQVIPELKANADDTVFVLAGDCPLIHADTIRGLIAVHQGQRSAATVLSARLSEPGMYGRILRGKSFDLEGIKEAKDCDDEELSINEINTGVYAFQYDALVEALSQVTDNNSQQEYYLTDVIHILKQKGVMVGAYCTEDPDAVTGVNTRQDLAKINKVVYRRNCEYFMTEGVTIIDPATTYIDKTAEIGRDTIVYPFSVISGATKIGKDCRVGPHCYLNNAVVEDGTTLGAFVSLDE